MLILVFLTFKLKEVPILSVEFQDILYRILEAFLTSMQNWYKIIPKILSWLWPSQVKRKNIVQMQVLHIDKLINKTYLDYI